MRTGYEHEVGLGVTQYTSSQQSRISAISSNEWGISWNITLSINLASYGGGAYAYSIGNIDISGNTTSKGNTQYIFLVE